MNAIDVLLGVTLTLFCLKIGWNLLVPYVMAVRLMRTGETRTKGISMLPAVEVVLALIALVLSCLPGASWLHDPTRVGLSCAAMIVASYLHLVAGGALSGWVVGRIKRRRS